MAIVAEAISFFRFWGDAVESTACNWRVSSSGKRKNRLPIQWPWQLYFRATRATTRVTNPSSIRELCRHNGGWCFVELTYCMTTEQYRSSILRFPPKFSFGTADATPLSYPMTLLSYYPSSRFHTTARHHRNLLAHRFPDSKHFNNTGKAYHTLTRTTSIREDHYFLKLLNMQMKNKIIMILRTLRGIIDASHWSLTPS